MKICDWNFSGQLAAEVCPNCDHAAMAHIGTPSCVVCRMEETLTPEWWAKQARIHGRPGLFQ